MPHIEREILIVLGRTGMGKSIWTRSFCKTKKRVFVFDPLQDFNAEYLTVDDLIKLHDTGVLTPNENAVIRVGVSNEDDLDVLASLAFLHGDCILVIEEGGFLFQPGARAPNWMREGVFLGRHRGLSILITAQRPTSIPVDLRSQASRVVCFNQREQRDMVWLSEYYGDRFYEIVELQPLECLDADSGGVNRYKIRVEMDDKKTLANS